MTQKKDSVVYQSEEKLKSPQKVNGDVQSPFLSSLLCGVPEGMKFCCLTRPSYFHLMALTDDARRIFLRHGYPNL